MTVFFTSDLHIGHLMVASLRVPGSTSAELHDRMLAENWDAIVKPDDAVWVLGDISAGGSSAQRNALEWIKVRPGVKHLIAGNHDGAHPLNRDSYKWQRIYLEAFESVQSGATRKIPTPEGPRRVLLSHFPYTEHGQHLPDRFLQWWLPDHGLPILHGHVHSRDRLTLSGASTRQIHVGVDAWDYRPVSLEQIGELL